MRGYFAISLGAVVSAGLLGCTEAAMATDPLHPRDAWVSTASPGMLRAFRLGNQSWPMGLELYGSVPQGKRKALLVKLSIATADQASENLFVLVTGNTDSAYAGELTGSPAGASKWSKGALVEFQNDDVLDWVLQVEGEPLRGGFTLCQIARHERPTGTAAQHLREHPEDCEWVDEYVRDPAD